MLIALAEWSNARKVFARWKTGLLTTGIVASNPARGLDVFIFSVSVLSCEDSGLGWADLHLRSPTKIVRFT
jgi:hypothetical protein